MTATNSETFLKMSNRLSDRNFMIMDGGYVNVPDYHSVAPTKKIGLREYNKGILVHNWFEERTPVKYYIKKDLIIL